VEIRLDVEEVLGDGAVGTGVDLALEVQQVGFGTGRLGMELRIGADFQREVVAAAPLMNSTSSLA